MELAYQDIAAYVEAGQTDAEIAEALRADPRTVRNLPVATARTLLQVEWRLLYIDVTTGRPAGPIADFYHDLKAIDDPFTPMLARFIEHILYNQSAVEIELATNKEYATAWWACLSQLTLTEEQRGTLDTLTGGRRYAGATAQDVADCKQRHADELLREELRERRQAVNDALLLAIDNLDDIATARAAMIAAWERA